MGKRDYGAKIDAWGSRYYTLPPEEYERGFQTLQEEATHNGDAAWARLLGFLRVIGKTEEDLLAIRQFRATSGQGSTPPYGVEILQRLALYEAATLGELGRYDEALKLLNMSSFGSHPVLWIKLHRARVWLFVQAKQYRTARANGEEIRAGIEGVNPVERSLILDILFLEKEALLREKNWSEYVQVCEEIEARLEELHPGTATALAVLYDRTTGLEMLRQYEECIQHLQQLLDRLRCRTDLDELIFESELRWCRCKILIKEWNQAKQRLDSLLVAHGGSPTRAPYRTTAEIQEPRFSRLSRVQILCAELLARQGKNQEACLCSAEALRLLDLSNEQAPLRHRRRLRILRFHAERLWDLNDAQPFAYACRDLLAQIEQLTDPNLQEEYLLFIQVKAGNCDNLALEEYLLRGVVALIKQGHEDRSTVQMLIAQLDLVFLLQERNAWEEIPILLQRIETCLRVRPDHRVEIVQVPLLFAQAHLDQHQGNLLDARQKLDVIKNWVSEETQFKVWSLRAAFQKAKWSFSPDASRPSERELKEAFELHKTDPSPQIQKMRAEILLAYADVAYPPHAYVYLKRFVRLHRARSGKNDPEKFVKSVQEKLEQVSTHMDGSDLLFAYLTSFGTGT